VSVAIFVDTVYWLALINPNDAWRAQALDWAARVAQPLVTTDAILTEVADALCRSDHRRWAIEAIRSVRSDPAITSVAGSAQLFEGSFELYSSRQDKDWSLTDCLSFVVMKDRKIDRALTADPHFVQAGFRALLRE
jgi:predicted nucleic acid-binding protein